MQIKSAMAINTISQMSSVSFECSVSLACGPVGNPVGNPVGSAVGTIVGKMLVPTSIQHRRVSLKRHPQMSLQLASVYETHGAHAVVQATSVIKIKNFIIWGLPPAIGGHCIFS